MQEVARLLAGSELLLLFATVLAGLLLGRISLGGLKLGIAGVLFAGLGLSLAASRYGIELRLAPELKEVGLVLFVYSVGLTSAPGFFTAFQKTGVSYNLAMLAALAAAAGTVAIAAHVFDLGPGISAGLFAGALTNTPALAAASDHLAGTVHELEPVLAYSITYPFGVVGGLLSFRLYWSLTARKLAGKSHHEKVVAPIESAVCRVENEPAMGHAIGELKVRDALGVVISRVQRGEETTVPTKYTLLTKGDVLTIVGEADAVARAIEFFGSRMDEVLPPGERQVDMRRILVSRRKFAGRTLAQLHLAERFHAQATRLRRADVDLVPTGDTRLQVGDRLRIVAPRENMKAIAAYFGDSERELATVDFVALALGIALGLLVAKIPFPLFGTTLSLGIAGGPLLVALLLGYVGRAGPLTFSIPYETNAALRELGILLFLAGVGVTAGGSLANVALGEALVVFGVGALVTLSAAIVSLLGLRAFAKADDISAIGATSGLQTQPANLAAAYELVGRREEIYVAYAITYPVAMIGKILIAQLLAAL